MITNKDLSIDSENGKIVLNGVKYDLGTQGEIDTAVKDVYSVMGQMGAKNLISYPFQDITKTVNGITFTDNGDGTITVSGTASANATFNIRDLWTASDLVELLPNTSYAFSGCPVGGSVSTYLIQFVNEESNLSNKSWFDDTGTGGTITTTDVKRFVGARIVIQSGTVFSTPVTFKPMLRLASDTDNTYEPYAMTNKQLTDQVAEVKGTIGDITHTGVTGATVASQIADIEGRLLKVANVSATMTVSTPDADAIGGYRSISQTSKVLSTFTGYPTGKVVVADSLHAYGANAATAAVVNVISGVVYLNAAKAADYTVEGVVFYHD